MAWRLRGFIIYWLSKFRRLKRFLVLYYNDYPNLVYLIIFFLYEILNNWYNYYSRILDNNTYRSIDSELLLSEKLADFLWSTPFDWIFNYNMVAFSQWSDIFSGTFLHDLLLLYSRYETESIEHEHVRWLKFSD